MDDKEDDGLIVIANFILSLCCFSYFPWCCTIRNVEKKNIGWWEESFFPTTVSSLLMICLPAFLSVCLHAWLPAISTHSTCHSKRGQIWGHVHKELISIFKFFYCWMCCLPWPWSLSCHSHWALWHIELSSTDMEESQIWLKLYFMLNYFSVSMETRYSQIWHKLLLV